MERRGNSLGVEVVGDLGAAEDEELRCRRAGFARPSWGEAGKYEEELFALCGVTLVAEVLVEEREEARG